jgi:homoserine O-acetyltransferase
MRFAVVALSLLAAGGAFGAEFPPPVEGDFTIKDFKFTSGETLPEVRLHYRTIGKPRRDEEGKVRNAVLILHGTGGSGANFLGQGAPISWFAGELFGPGQPLDGEKYYLILPDNIGHGKSSKPSDGRHARFPRYGYRDMLAAQHRLLTDGLKVDQLRLVMGTSMGGMHTWLWGETYPDFMDALLPLASLPTQISGRNRLWRKMVSDAIRNDPGWVNGEYKTQPHNLRLAAQMLLLVSSNPVIRQKQAPTLKAADAFFDKAVADSLKRLDANDLLYAVESSWDYDPAPGLEKIRAPLFAVNFADDLINPPELGILEKQIKRVKRGRAVIVPMSAETVGHGTHTKAAVWKQYLETLLKESER